MSRARKMSETVKLAWANGWNDCANNAALSARPTYLTSNEREAWSTGWVARAERVALGYFDDSAELEEIYGPGHYPRQQFPA